MARHDGHGDTLAQEEHEIVCDQGEFCDTDYDQLDACAQHGGGAKKHDDGGVSVTSVQHDGDDARAQVGRVSAPHGDDDDDAVSERLGCQVSDLKKDPGNDELLPLGYHHP